MKTTDRRAIRRQSATRNRRRRRLGGFIEKLEDRHLLAGIALIDPNPDFANANAPEVRIDCISGDADDVTNLLRPTFEGTLSIIAEPGSPAVLATVVIGIFDRDIAFDPNDPMSDPTSLALGSTTIGDIRGTTDTSTGDDSFSITLTQDMPTDGDLQLLVYRTTKLTAGNILARDFDVTYDNDSPGVSISTSVSETSFSDFTATFSFDEDVTDLTADDIVVGNGSISGVTPSSGFASTFTATVTPDGGGDVTIDLPAGSVVDRGGNSNTAATQRVVSFDGVPPENSDVPTLATEDDSGPVDINGVVQFTDDGITRFNDNLTFVGQTSEAISVDVRITNGDLSFDETVSASLAADGSYTAEFTFDAQPGGVIPHGIYTVVSTASDGPNQTDSPPFSLNIDLVAPAAPTLDLTDESDSSGDHTSQTDDLTGETTLVFAITNTESDAAAVLTRDGADVTVEFPASGQAISTLTDNSLTDPPDRSYQYTASQSDLAGNVSSASASLVLAVDATSPQFGDVDPDSNGTQTIQLASGDMSVPDSDLIVSVTENPSPTFEFQVIEQQTLAKDNLLLIELFEDGNATPLSVTTRLIANGGGNSGANVDAAPIDMAMQSDTPFETGEHRVFVRVTDGSGNSQDSPSFDFFVSSVGAPTIGSPGTPVLTETHDIRVAFNRALGVADDQLVQPWQQSFDKRTQTVWFTTEAASTVGQFDPATGSIRAFDLASVSAVDRTETVLAADALETADSILVSAGGFLTADDIPKGSLITIGTDESAESFLVKSDTVPEGDDLRVTISGQLDADHLLTSADDSRVRVRDSGDNPHGVFFDFNTHLTPRIWSAHRMGKGTNAGPRETLGIGRLSYFDLVSNEIVAYEFNDDAIRPMLADSGFTDGGGEGSLEGFHAVFVDVTGDVWFSIPESFAIVQLDFDSEASCGLNCRTATAIVHPFPDGLVNSAPFAGVGESAEAQDKFQPHAFQVIIDDKTGEKWVWSIDVGGSGRVALMFPGQQSDLTEQVDSGNNQIVVDDPFSVGSTLMIGNGADKETVTVSEVSGDGPFTLTLSSDLTLDHAQGVSVNADDRWTTWDVDQGTEHEDSDPTERSRLSNATGTFIQVDDNETPGFPNDDHVVATFPVAASRSTGGTIGLINRYSLVDQDNPLTSSARIQSWQIPKIPGSISTIDHSAVNQPYVDRSGTIFYIDRYGSVGRLDPIDFNENIDDFYTDRVSDAIEVETQSQIFVGAIEPTRERAPQATVSISTDPVIQTGNQNADDRSQLPGLDQYEVADTPDNSKNSDRGTGAFRGTINATNVLYGSIAQNDRFGVTIFAETSRKQMATVVSPQVSAGSISQSRMSFQTVRDGSLVMAARGDGMLADDQFNLLDEMVDRDLLTVEQAAQFLIVGEPAAAISGNDVNVIGRSSRGGVIQFTYDNPSDGPWQHNEIFDVTNWSVRHRTEGFDGLLLGEDTVPAGPAIGFTATTVDGHLIAIPIDGLPRNLTVESGELENGRVYSAATPVPFDGELFIYGTNQTGNLVEYKVTPTTSEFVRIIEAPGRDTRMTRNVRALSIDGDRHLFATDGLSRLVHWELADDGSIAVAENLSQLTSDNGNNFGYFPFQQPFTGRMYTYVAPLLEADGTIRVYGTNGGDLIEFTRDTAGEWRVANLTNDTHSTFGDNPDAPQHRVPANAVFGSPTAYIDPNGGRHILQINGDGEFVEYYTFGDGLMPDDPIAADRINSQNINFFTGKESTDLIFTALAEANAPAPLAESELRTESESPEVLQASPQDVDGNGTVTALDALLVINELGRSGRTTGETVRAASRTYDYDVNDDGRVSALDALVIINHLDEPASDRSPEGESVLWLQDEDEREVWDSALTAISSEPVAFTL